jgi:drug/metabolite transporter (DMT)-like permease
VHAQVLAGSVHFSHLTWAVLGYMCLSGLFNNVLADYLWARSVVLTSSTVATVGLSITIPLAILSDLLAHNTSPTSLSAGGAVLVIVGFCLVNVSRETEAAMYVYLCVKNGSVVPSIRRRSKEQEVEISVVL